MYVSVDDWYEKIAHQRLQNKHGFNYFIPSESDAKKMSESLDIKKTVGIKVVLKINNYIQVVTAAIDNI